MTFSFFQFIESINAPSEWLHRQRMHKNQNWGIFFKESRVVLLLNYYYYFIIKCCVLLNKYYSSINRNLFATENSSNNLQKIHFSNELLSHRFYTLCDNLTYNSLESQHVL